MNFVISVGVDGYQQVDDIAEASKSISTLQIMVDRDIDANCVRKAGSHTRNLLRVKRGLDMVRVLFERIIATEYVHLFLSLIKDFSKLINVKE